MQEVGAYLLVLTRLPASEGGKQNDEQLEGRSTVKDVSYRIVLYVRTYVPARLSVGDR